MDRVVVAGASLAGLNAARALRREGFAGTVTLLGAERHPPYQRPPLSKEILEGRWEPERANLKVEPELDLDLQLGRPATGLSLGDRTVATADGPVPFDGLVIATGAAPRRLPALGELAGVHYLRTVDDCLALRADLERGPRVVVVGAGFIGSEVASSCRARGLEVTVLEALPVPLERALGPEMGAACAALHRDNGTVLRTGTAVKGLVGADRVEGVQLDDEVLPADVVVVGIGVAPATDWLQGSGLDLANGVRCDAACACLDTAGRPVDGVVAAGDVARWPHPLFDTELRLEHWDNAVSQGQAAARTLLARAAGHDADPFGPVPFFWSDQYGVKLQFVGISETADAVTVVEGSVEERRFVAAYSRSGRTIGALLVGRPNRMPHYRTLVADGGRQASGSAKGSASGSADAAPGGASASPP